MFQLDVSISEAFVPLLKFTFVANKYINIPDLLINV